MTVFIIQNGTQYLAFDSGGWALPYDELFDATHFKFRTEAENVLHSLQKNGVYLDYSVRAYSITEIVE